MAAQNQVIIFTLPPHTTHVIQPLDRRCFAPLKVSWRQICHQFIAKNPGKTVSQYDFCRLFSQAWLKAISIENVVSSFRVTRVNPLDRSVTKAHALEPNDNEDFALFKPEALARKTGLAYIPLYSPALGLQSPIVKLLLVLHVGQWMIMSSSAMERFLVQIDLWSWKGRCLIQTSTRHLFKKVHYQLSSTDLHQLSAIF